MLLGEEHLLDGVLFAGLEAIQVEATGHQLPVAVAAVPLHLIAARLLHPGHQLPHLLPHHIVDGQPNLGCPE